jgi:hypothetical protein
MRILICPAEFPRASRRDGLIPPIWAVILFNASVENTYTTRSSNLVRWNHDGMCADKYCFARFDVAGLSDLEVRWQDYQNSPSTKPRRRSRPLPAAAPFLPPRRAFLPSSVIVRGITERISTKGQTSGTKVVGHGIPDLARALSCRCFFSSASPYIQTLCNL